MSFCSHCGKQITEGAAFCPHCGAPAQRPGMQQSPPPHQPAMQQNPPPQKKNPVKWIILAVILLTLAAAAAFGGMKMHTGKVIAKELNQGKKYLEEGSYDDAIDRYNKVLEKDPDNEDAYAGLINAYLAKGDPDKAEDVLKKAKKRMPRSKKIEDLTNKVEDKIRKKSGKISVWVCVEDATENGVLTYEYDSKGRITNGHSDYEAYDYEYNSDNTRKKVEISGDSYAYGGFREYEYDGSKRLTAVGFAVEQGGATNTQLEYDKNSRIKKTTFQGDGPEQIINEYQYDKKGYITGVAQTEAFVGEGERSTINWVYQYDSQKRIVRAKGDKDGLDITFKYDEHGNLTDAAGEFSYGRIPHHYTYKKIVVDRKTWVPTEETNPSAISVVLGQPCLNPQDIDRIMEGAEPVREDTNGKKADKSDEGKEAENGKRDIEKDPDIIHIRSVVTHIKDKAAQGDLKHFGDKSAGGYTNAQGDIQRIDLGPGQGHVGADTTEEYYFEKKNGKYELIFVFSSDGGKDENRFWFKDDTLIQWNTGSGSDQKAHPVDEEYEEMESTLLGAAYREVTMVSGNGGE